MSRSIGQRNSGRARQETVVAYLFVAPAVVLIALFVIWPTLSMVLSSVFDGLWRPQVPAKFVGAVNYADVLGSARFRQSVLNTLWFALLVVPLQSVAALLLAVWVNGGGVARRVLRTAIFVPTTLSLVVLCILWTLMYAPPSSQGAGLLNGLLMRSGLSAAPFLTHPGWALPALAAMSIWQGVGLQMLIFLSGLQQIPTQLYEAARIDGAGGVRSFRHITLPGVAPTAVFVVTITAIFALKLFAQPYIMTKGGPDGNTRSVVQYIYEAFATEQNLGLSCAAAVLFFAGVLVVTLLLRLVGRRMEKLA